MKKILIFASVAVCFVSCNKMSTGETGFDKIYFNVEHPNSTKATATSFVQNDEISLFAVEYVDGQKAPLQKAGNFINNEKLIYDGNNWPSEHPLYWSDKACDFYGFYPYQPDFLSIEYFPFKVALNQNNGGFESSDLMYAIAENVSKENGAVNLSFNHLMTKLNVVLKKGDKFKGDVPDDVVAHIYNTTTSCVVDWAKGSVEKDAFGSKSTITMKKLNNMHFEAILVPQNLEKKTPLVEITMGGIAYLLEYSLSLRAGCVHTITVTLNTSPDQEMIEISIDPTQGDWN